MSSPLSLGFVPLIRRATLRRHHCGSSGWSREYIGRAKEAGGHSLTRSTAWRIRLRERPEHSPALGDFVWDCSGLGIVDGMGPHNSQAEAVKLTKECFLQVAP